MQVEHPQGCKEALQVRISVDGLVKSPSTALRFNFSHCSVLPLSPTTWWRVPSLARLASGAFYCAVHFMASYEIVRVNLDL